MGPRIYELESSPRVNAVRVEVDATNLKLPVPCSLQNSKQWVPQMKCLHVTHDRLKVPKDNDVAEGFPDGCGVLRKNLSMVPSSLRLTHNSDLAAACQPYLSNTSLKVVRRLDVPKSLQESSPETSQHASNFSAPHTSDSATLLQRQRAAHEPRWLSPRKA